MLVTSIFLFFSLCNLYFLSQVVKTRDCVVKGELYFSLSSKYHHRSMHHLSKFVYLLTLYHCSDLRNGLLENILGKGENNC